MKKIHVVQTLLLILFCTEFNIILGQDIKQDTMPGKIIELPQGCKLVLDSTIDLADSVSIKIVEGIRNILPRVLKLIPADSVIINLAINREHILPVWGVGGRTTSVHSIEFYFDPNHPNFKVENVLRGLVHEFHHVGRLRSGCGVRCVEGNSPCRGCYGPPPGATDPGAKMMAAIGTMIDANKPEEIDEIIETIVDPAGLFYRFSLPCSILGRKVL